MTTALMFTLVALLLVTLMAAAFTTGRSIGYLKGVRDERHASRLRLFDTVPFRYGHNETPRKASTHDQH